MSKIKGYLQSSYEEFAQKATWPTLSDLQKSTVLVIVASVIFALAIFVMDQAIVNVLEFLRTFFN
ncbi:preprotein translocase subunit SecE [Phaeocystidibacter luteus]|uniref:Protein translocase subunit SecE n=1 Tax=Phaeocystidibacter luteus TaxID=911197 RepID=A0A6N6RHD1_9FLAO|nr:preprotein translocase subunit SecE [Phaeocystidibacter luteus]KAB2809729.1 preprotein translocase subunit SecE [Phaeocystidibacter luteus]